jgi:hypothetical protein
MWQYTDDSPFPEKKEKRPKENWENNMAETPCS